MAINFPSSPADGAIFTDSNGTQWVYKSSDKSWTSLGIVNDTGGLKYKGGLDITAAPPAAASGEFWSVETGGTANGGFGPNVTGTISAGDFVLYDGVNWEQINVDPLWNRSGGDISPKNASDTIQTDSGLKVGPTGTPTIVLASSGAITAAGNIQSGGNPNSGVVGSKIYSNGVIQGCADSSSDAVFAGLLKGSNVANASISAGGEGFFKGNVKIGDSSSAPKVQISSDNGNIDIRNISTASGCKIYGSGAYYVRSDATQQGSAVWKAYKDGQGDSTTTSVIYGKGGAWFKDTVDIGNNFGDDGNIKLNKDGSITAGTYNGLTVGTGAGNVTTNMAVGFQALNANTDGDKNVAIGQQALYTNLEGNNNVAIGYSALYLNETGSSNVAIGRVALYENTEGNYNVAYGYGALANNTTGSDNIGIGFYNSSGYNPVFDPTTEDNRLVLGHKAITHAYVKVAWTFTSDERDKMNFAPVPYGLDFVNQLKPTAFQFKVDRDTETPNGNVRFGFKAQDILALEGDNPVIIDTEDADHLKYKGEHLVPVLVNAVQELTAMVKDLQAEIKTLKG